MSEQLTFDLPTRPALERGDFFIANSNALALAMIEDCENWPQNKHLLVGPKGSGKRIWPMSGPINAAPASLRPPI